MSIKIISPGRLKQGFIKTGVYEYLKRLSPYVKVEMIEIADVKLTSSNNIEIVKLKEAEIISKHLKDRSFKIALDEKGALMNSIAFSKLIGNNLSKKITFIIGGVYGLSEDILAEVDYRLSFSEMTFTHQMIRMILLEQMYRAFTIMKDKKYHY